MPSSRTRGRRPPPRRSSTSWSTSSCVSRTRSTGCGAPVARPEGRRLPLFFPGQLLVGRDASVARGGRNLRLPLLGVVGDRRGPRRPPGGPRDRRRPVGRPAALVPPARHVVVDSGVRIPGLRRLLLGALGHGSSSA